MAASASLGAFTSLNVNGYISISGKYLAVRKKADAESQPPDNETTTCLGMPLSS